MNIAVVKLYSNVNNEISRFLKSFSNEKFNIDNKLEWQKSYPNPVEIADIIGAFVENNDKYNINMWVSLDKNIFINVTDDNADKIIRYIYERYPW